MSKKNSLHIYFFTPNKFIPLNTFVTPENTNSVGTLLIGGTVKNFSSKV